MQDKNYYHFTTWDISKLEKDMDYRTPSDYSHYWKNKLKKDYAKLCFNQNKDQIGIPKIFENIKMASGISLRDQIIKEIEEIYVQGKYTSELLKEYIFEEVRINSFPRLPSRKRCIFLFDKELDIVSYANRLEFDMSNYSLLEIEAVEPIGKIFRANMQLLDVNSGDYGDFKKNAEEYWACCSQIDINSEVLFEGNYRIKEIVKNL
ncbi:MAG: DUF2441 domain-containing protein [Candidatus Hodarchaeales archaeon]|jgi:hypothetical protein